MSEETDLTAILRDLYSRNCARIRRLEDEAQKNGLEIKRLRGLVRRLADNLRRYHINGERDTALLKEAREVLGESARSTGNATLHSMGRMPKRAGRRLYE